MNKRWLGIALVGLVGCGALDDAKNAIKETEAKVERSQKLSGLAALVGVSHAPTKAKMPDRTTEPTTTATSPAVASFLTAGADNACETVNRNRCVDEASDTCEIGVVWNACPDITGAAHFKAVTTPTSVDFAVQFTNVTIAQVNIDGSVAMNVTMTDKKLKTLKITDTATYKYNDPAAGEKTITPGTVLDWNAETQVLNFTATVEANSVAIEALTYAASCASGVVSGKVTLKEGAESFVFNFSACGKGTYTNKDGVWDMEANEHGLFVGLKPGTSVAGMELE